MAFCMVKVAGTFLAVTEETAKTEGWMKIVSNRTESEALKRAKVFNEAGKVRAKTETIHDPRGRR